MARGGKREGAGRKAQGITKKVSLTLTQEEWEKLDSLGDTVASAVRKLMSTVSESEQRNSGEIVAENQADWKSQSEQADEQNENQIETGNQYQKGLLPQPQIAQKNEKVTTRKSKNESLVPRRLPAYKNEVVDILSGRIEGTFRLRGYSVPYKLQFMMDVDPYFDLGNLKEENETLYMIILKRLRKRHGSLLDQLAKKAEENRGTIERQGIDLPNMKDYKIIGTE